MKSHPHQSLKTHLEESCMNAKAFINKHSVNLTDKSLMEKLLITAVACHDFGKSTKYFQDFMEKVSAGKDIKSGHLERHSLISAIVGYNLAKKILQVNNFDVETLALYTFTIIKRHHGNLVDFSKETNIIDEADISLLLKQADSINMDKLNCMLKELSEILPNEVKAIMPINSNQLHDWIKTFNDELNEIRIGQHLKKLKNKKNSEFERDELGKLNNYFLFAYLYSILIESDKSQVVLGKLQERAGEIPVNLVQMFKSETDWEESELNSLRESAFVEIDTNLNKAKEGSIFEITLPTGLGKTLAAYNFALKLRKLRFREREITPKIIYSLPFLSVIDQNFLVMKEIFEKVNIKHDHSTILKHHHLTETKYVTFHEEDELQYDTNVSKFLIEGWYSDIIITTFNQLFETLISYKNRNLRRFHKLSNAIILIDEVQAVPVKYWELLRYTLLFLSKNMNTDIVLITATQPKIFSSKDNVIQLCDSAKYFNHKSLDRIEMRVDLKQKTIEEFAEEVCIEDDKRYLFILNTIGSAKELYNKLSEKIEEPIVFLSTQVVMKDRMQRIKNIKNNPNHRIVISTQLVEAGVDIDFDVVYRDIAPMDSLNQAAGRCNRNGKGSGVIKVIHLWNGRRSYSGMVYNDQVRIKITKDILSDYINQHKFINEKSLLQLIEKYFTEVKSKINKQESTEIIEALYKLRFYSDDPEKAAVSNFKLIEEQYDRVNVFIELNEEAAEIWEEYSTIMEIDDVYQRKDKFSEIKSRFYDYVISVPRSYDLPAEVNQHYYVTNSMLDTYYDLETGYKASAELLIW